jgi:hypothetical protein
MADDISKRLDALEEQVVEEKPRDLVLTALEEQWDRADDGTMIPSNRQPIGYSEIVWSEPDTGGRRIGNRHAIYDGQVSSFDPVENQAGDCEG